MLVWTQSLAIGNALIDAQHKTLFERASRFEAAVRAHEPTYRLEDLFAYLVDYAKKHFEAEEQLMREVRYPGLADHMHEHAEFRRRLLSLVPQWESEGDSTAMLLVLLGFLESWLTEHVTKSDQRIADHIRQ